MHQTIFDKLIVWFVFSFFKDISFFILHFSHLIAVYCKDCCTAHSTVWNWQEAVVHDKLVYFQVVPLAKATVVQYEFSDVSMLV